MNGYLFGKIVVPSAVHAELSSYHAELPAWLSVRAVPDAEVLKDLLEQLGPGEAEAIALAKILGADLLIIDEKRGRTLAENLGLRCMGLAGTLLLAKQRRLIVSLEEMLNQLESKANFYLATSVKRRLLAAAGEALDP